MWYSLLPSLKITSECNGLLTSLDQSDTKVDGGMLITGASSLGGNSGGRILVENDGSDNCEWLWEKKHSI